MPTLFNPKVDNVVQKWLAMMVEDQLVAKYRLGLVVGRCLVLFYSDNVMVRLWDPEWIQGAGMDW